MGWPIDGNLPAVPLRYRSAHSAECRRLDPIVLRAHDIPSWCSANVDPRASAAPRAPCVTAWFECLGLGGCGGGAKTEPGAESPVEMVPAR